MVKILFSQFSLFKLYKLFFIQYTAFSRSPSWAQKILLFGPKNTLVRVHQHSSRWRRWLLGLRPHHRHGLPDLRAMGGDQGRRGQLPGRSKVGRCPTKQQVDTGVLGNLGLCCDRQKSLTMFN